MSRLASYLYYLPCATGGALALCTLAYWSRGPSFVAPVVLEQMTPYAMYALRLGVSRASESTSAVPADLSGQQNIYFLRAAGKWKSSHYSKSVLYSTIHELC